MLYRTEGLPPIDTSKVSRAAYVVWVVRCARRLNVIDFEQLCMWYQGECTDSDVLEAIATHGESRHATTVALTEHAIERVRDLQVLVACANNLRCGLNEDGHLIGA